MSGSLPDHDHPPDTITGDSIVELFLRRIERSGGDEAILLKHRDVYRPRTWEQLADDVFRLAALLRGQGLEPGDRVAQVSENCYRWIVADLAVQLIGSVHVALHPSLSGRQLAEQLHDCEPRALFVSGQEQWRKLVAFKRENLVGWSYEPLDPSARGTIRPIDEALASLSTREALELRSYAAEVASAERLATIIYTSGSTGQPRGAMLSSGNLAFNARACVAAFAERPGDIRLNFLPLSHVFARTCDMYSWIVRGSVLALAQQRETIIADCQAVRPTLLNGVPYFFEKVRRGLVEKQKAGQPNILRETLGGTIRLCTSGGSALANETVDYYQSQGVTLVQGYGLTETSPVITLSTEAVHRKGAVGRALPGVELRLAHDAELLTRGPHVMSGYWNDPAATARAIRSGWFHTGDLGRIDEEGFLWITGRKKEMINTAGGKTIAPTEIESRLMLDPLIEQACVVGEGERFLAALIVPNPMALRAAIRRMRLWVFSRRGALRHKRVLALYREAIDARLADMGSHQQIGRFHLLGRGFTPENGELTPKLSLRRKVIEEHLTEEIRAMFRS